MSENLVFDLLPIEINVSIGDDNYVLRESSGDAACRYRNLITSCAKRQGEDMVINGPIADAEPLWVSMCLFKVDADGNTAKNHVKVETVRSWPERVVKILVAKLQEISPIDSDGDEDVAVLEKERDALTKKIDDLESAKNSQSNTADG